MLKLFYAITSTAATTTEESFDGQYSLYYECFVNGRREASDRVTNGIDD